ncbi:hydroxyethylthiazole kinase [Schnuerera sp. xch1]|nr:hydroxyethylthiazole kinase [Schnuerera sp. xch1]
MLENVNVSSPLVHNITNYVTVNDCANALLACGGSPIMADNVLEVEDITSISNALVINIGTLNERTIESMIKAGKKANEINIPVIFDPVGAGASKLRMETTFRLLKEIKFSVIRGNVSEIKVIGEKSIDNKSRGVDASVSDKITDKNLDEYVIYAKNLSKKIGSVIAITGAIDIIAYNNKAFVIRNGHPIMSKISGTGCMLSSIIGAYCGANYDKLLDATVAAVSIMGICGEKAYEKMKENSSGTSSCKVHLIDYISRINKEILEERAKIEIR